MKSSFRYAWMTMVALAMAAPCDAQVFVGRDIPRKGSVEVSGGGVYQSGKDLANLPATLTRNPTTGTGALELFRADASLASAFGGLVRIGYFVTPAISLEGGVQIVRPKLEVSLSADFEGAPPIVASESINSYVFTGSLLYHLGTGSRMRPFLLAGAGHVRDLHDGDVLVESGVEYHVGGGIKSWFGSGRRRFGARAEALVSIRDGGVGADEDRRMVPTLGFSLSYVF